MDQTAADVAEQTEQPKYQQNNNNGPQHGQSFPFELSFPFVFVREAFSERDSVILLRQSWAAEL